MDVMLNRVAAMPVRRVFAHLFFLFLVCPILNPALGGETRYSATTVYLYCLFPLLDWKFLRLQLTHVNGPVAAGLLSLLAAVATADMAVAVRMMALGLCFAYLGFLYREGELPLLGAYTLASAAVAVVQFALAMLGSPLQEYLYPDRIAGMLWGDAAILARPSFDDGVLFPVRVAGLSREPSFFNLQVVATLFIHAFVTRIFFRPWGLTLVVAIAFLSFSKITLIVVIGGGFVILGRRFLDRVPVYAAFLLWLVAGAAATSVLYDQLGGPYAVAQGELGETVLHRTIGYHLLTELKGSELVLGLGRGEILGEIGRFPYIDLVFGADKVASLVLAGSGAAQSVIEYGLISTLVQLACVSWFGLGSAGLILYLVFGLTMNPLVVTSHSVIVGFLAFALRTRRSGNSARLCRMSLDIR